MQSHQVARALRRELVPDPFTLGPWQWGVVEAVNTSPVASVNLYLDGSTTVTPNVRYLSSYTPTAGDTVFVARYGSDRIVLGKLA